MTPEEAKAELDACTLRPQDASEEARAQVAQDAQLGAWAAARTEFDERVASAMEDIPVPAGLHAKLLGLAGAPPPPRKRIMPRIVFALAAAAVLVFMGFSFWMNAARSRGWRSEALAQVQLVQHGLSRLEHRSKDLAELKRLLLAQGALSPGELPAALAKLKTYGCRTVQVAGKPASIVCFELAPGKEAHLLVMNTADLPGAPGNAPSFAKEGGWSFATWSSGGQSFMLATVEDEKLLKSLLS